MDRNVYCKVCGKIEPAFCCLDCDTKQNGELTRAQDNLKAARKEIIKLKAELEKLNAAYERIGH